MNNSDQYMRNAAKDKDKTRYDISKFNPVPDLSNYFSLMSRVLINFIQSTHTNYRCN